MSLKDVLERYYSTYNSEDPEKLAGFYHPEVTLSSAEGTMEMSPRTTKCCSKPNALHNHSIAACASLYRSVGIIVEFIVLLSGCLFRVPPFPRRMTLNVGKESWR